ncbi:MAG TPA: RelA/SpoT family protein, partial [candidate division Zixibacteria bacterium]|nr:RelA/SpoT family protein [candidate division Zixibacteria bacterium]
ADRVHNMRTLESVPRDKQIRIAQETRDIYAPLANRFGIAKAKVALEDLSLKYLEPERYQDLAERLAETREDRERYVAEIVRPIRQALEREGIRAEAVGRAKHLDSINRKILVRGVPFEKIFDLTAIRIIVATVHECYHVLGVIHSMWKPTPDRFHDYVANPKPNGYQSLHTTVVGPGGRLVEIQIRTRQMHYVAENGIAAHWLYKEGKKTFDKSDQQMNWLRDVLEWQKDMKDPAEFMEYLKVDLFPHDIYVFTPAGRIIHLPAGATPLDFAFAVHTEVGMRCAGAKINDRIAQISTPLKSGDVVEVITHPGRTPSRDWLNIVVTSNARSRIRRWLKKSGRERLVALGKDILEREAKKRRLNAPNDQELADVAESFSLKSGDSLLAGIGNGDISAIQALGRAYPAEFTEEHTRPHSERPPADTSDAIKIQGLDDMYYRLAGCCQPIPGDRIVGYVTRGRGVTVHRRDCANMKRSAMDYERRVEATWDVGGAARFPVYIEVAVIDRANILRDITQVVADSEAYLRSAQMSASAATTLGRFQVEVSTLE